MGIIKIILIFILSSSASISTVLSETSVAGDSSSPAAVKSTEAADNSVPPESAKTTEAAIVADLSRGAKGCRQKNCFFFIIIGVL